MGSQRFCSQRTWWCFECVQRDDVAAMEYPFFPTSNGDTTVPARVTGQRDEQHFHAKFCQNGEGFKAESITYICFFVDDPARVV